MATTGQLAGLIPGDKRGAPLLDPATTRRFLPARARRAEGAHRRAVEAMMEQGRAGRSPSASPRAGLDPALPVMRAHGVPGLIDYLAGRVTLAEAIERGQRDTRAYSKRQVTFVRHQLPEFAMRRRTARGMRCAPRSSAGRP